MNKLMALILGILAALGALFFQAVVVPLSFEESFLILIFFGIFIAFTEEFFKFLIIWKISKDEKKKTNIFLNSALVGIGFSLTEIFLNISKNNFFSTDYILSYAGLLVLHTTTAVIFGYFFSKKNGLKKTTALAVFILSIIIHFVYNFLIYYDFSQFLIQIPLIILILSLSLRYYCKQKNSCQIKKNGL